MNCPNCNHPLAPNGKFCPVCGTPVVPDSFSEAKTQVMEETAPTQEYIPQEPAHDATREYVPQPSDNGNVPPQQYNDPFQQSANYDYPPQPPQPQTNSYNQQFRQYQQPSRYGATHASQPNGAPDMSRKNNLPLIIIIIVLAVLLVGGGIFTAILLINGNKTPAPAATVPATTISATVPVTSAQSSQSSAEESSREEQSSNAQEQTSAAESSQVQSDADESSQAQSSVPYSGSTALKNSKGVVIADDPAIHADDSAAEAKLNAYLSTANIEGLEETMATDNYSVQIYAKGNAVVYEMTMLTDLTDAQKQSIQSSLSAIQSSMSETVREGRKESDVDDMVVVYAYVSKDGSPFANAVCE